MNVNANDNAPPLLSRLYGGGLASGISIPEESKNVMVLEIRDLDADSDDLTHRLRETLTDASGTVRFDLKDTLLLGCLEICIGIRQTSGRRYPKPSLVSVLQGTTIDPLFEETEDEMTKANMEHHENQKHAKVHLNYLDRVVANLVKEANLLLSTADQIKDEEAAFHKKKVLT